MNSVDFPEGSTPLQRAMQEYLDEKHRRDFNVGLDFASGPDQTATSAYCTVHSIHLNGISCPRCAMESRESWTWQAQNDPRVRDHHRAYQAVEVITDPADARGFSAKRIN